MKKKEKMIALENWTSWRYVNRHCLVCGSSTFYSRSQDLVADTDENRCLRNLCDEYIKDKVVAKEHQYKCIRCHHLEQEIKELL